MSKVAPMVWRSRHRWVASLVAAVAVLSLVAAACDADGGETGATGELEDAAGGQTGATSEPAVTFLGGVDYLLDLETGAETPLPESIRGAGRNAYAISPDGSEVAYYGAAEDVCSNPEACKRAGHVEVFVAHLDGTHVRQITHGGVPEWKHESPGWSPDGTRIAYVGRPNRDVKSNIFVIDLTDGVTTQVTFETVYVSGAQFSPNGSSIVYTAHLPHGSQVRMVSATGGEGSRLVGGHGSDASGASLSPEGSLLSYICGEDLCLANGDGSDPGVIAEADDEWGIRSGSWSPDGSRLAYWDFGPLDVHIIDVETGETTRGVAWLEAAWPTWVDDHTLIIERYSGPH